MGAPRSLPAVGRDLQFRLLDSCDSNQVVLQASLQRPVGMDRHGDTGIDTGLHIDMVASVYALQLPAFAFKKAAQPFPADGLQIAISIILSFAVTVMACTSTDRQPSTAS